MLNNFNLSEKHKKWLYNVGFALAISYLLYGLYDFATGLKLNLTIVILVIWGLFHIGNMQAKKFAVAISTKVVKSFGSKMIEDLNKNLAFGNEPRLRLSNLEVSSLEKVLTAGLKVLVEKEVKEKLYYFFIGGIVSLVIILAILMLLQIIPPLAGLVMPPTTNVCPPN